MTWLGYPTLHRLEQYRSPLRTLARSHPSHDDDLILTLFHQRDDDPILARLQDSLVHRVRAPDRVLNLIDGQAPHLDRGTNGKEMVPFSRTGKG